MAPKKAVSSQEAIDQFWKTFTEPAKVPSKASAILPRNVYTRMVEKQVPKGKTETTSVTTSYEDAKKICLAKVAQISKECRRINQKYNDPYFDLELRWTCRFPLYVIKDTSDSDSGENAAVYGLVQDNNPSAGRLELYGLGQAPAQNSGPVPPCVKRIGDIFDNPRFFVEGVNAKDIRQGSDGDCWFLSSLAALCSMEPAQNLIEKVCVARDEEVGVYGFVLFRDGEWITEVVDDKLYLRKADFEDNDEQERRIWEDNRIRINSEEEYRKEFQSNSRALYYAQSSHPDETWVPLVEKAFAKAHGDYAAIDGGYVGEGVEDLTGGLSTQIICTDILSKNTFWEEGLLKVNEEFLFGCGTRNWDDPDGRGRDGVIGGHAYSILKAKNYGKERLVMIKNPWGKTEWNGPWSDGSSEWTAESIKELGHTFGDDGVFWIRFEDLLRKYDVIWRTRLFNDEWNVTQQWSSLAIPWAGEYQDARFEVVLAQDAPVAIVLSQLDDRYFMGFEGQYRFQLSFRLHKAGEDDYIMRTYGEFYGQRSTSVETELEAGTYEVRLKISADRSTNAAKVEDVVKSNWLVRREKLLRIGLSYDLAHAKGLVEVKEPEKETPKPAAEANAEITKKPDIEMVTESTAELSIKPNETQQAEAAPDTKEGGFGKTPLEYEGSFAGDYTADAEKDKPADDADKEDEDKPEEDPWSAACVVGLRVYCKGTHATVQFIRPKEEIPEAKPKLDVDDPAKDLAKDGDVTKASDVTKDSDVVNTPKTSSDEGSTKETGEKKGDGEEVKEAEPHKEEHGKGHKHHPKKNHKGHH